MPYSFHLLRNHETVNTKAPPRLCIPQELTAPCRHYGKKHFCCTVYKGSAGLLGTHPSHCFAINLCLSVLCYLLSASKVCVSSYTYKMVHLSTIPDEGTVNDKLLDRVKKVHLQLVNDDDDFTTSVYGSRFAAADLPRHEMPETEMPKEVAYRMIKDELSLDGNPMLK